MNALERHSLKKPTGTINYYPHTFNKITSNRTILFQGAVPLHEIVYIIYDFCLHYINNTSKNVDTYLSMIKNNTSLSRPITLTILKLNGLKTKKQRQKKIREIIPELINTFQEIFNHFLTVNNSENNPYREDTHLNNLKQSRHDFIDTIIPQLNSLLNV